MVHLIKSFRKSRYTISTDGLLSNIIIIIIFILSPISNVYKDTSSVD